MTEKRFTIIYNEDTKMMQYVDNQKEEPNRWAICNASETAQKLNNLSEENEQLKGAVAYYEFLFESLQQYAKDFTERHNKKGYKMTEKERSCGHCKYLQIDGMFGMWCEKGRNWKDTDAEYCSDYER